MNRKHIWLIDDDPTTNLVHTVLLRHLDANLHVQEFQQPLAALNLLKELQELGPNFVPSMIFLDINMPCINGWDFLAHLEKLEVAPTLIMVSSSINPQDRNRAIKHSMVSDFISKPLSLRQLQDISHHWLSPVSGTELVSQQMNDFTFYERSPNIQPS